MLPRILGVLFLLGTCISTLQAADCSTADDHEEILGKCYMRVDNEMTLEDAEDFCLNEGGIVAMVTSQDVHDAMVDVMKDEGWRRMWVGVKEVNTPWRWVKDNSYIQYQGCYEDQDDDLLSDWDRSNDDWVPETCIAECKDRNDEYKYAGVKFTDDGDDIICACARDFKMEGIVKSGCSNKCRLDGFTDVNCGGAGLMQVYRVDGTEFNDWLSNQPNNNSDYQSCMSMNKDSFRWGDEECHGDEASSTRYSHFCEYDMSESQCDSAGSSYQYDTDSGMCITVHRNSELSWFEARAECDAEGGYLASIKTPEAQAFLESEAENGDRWWVGASNRKWIWGNGAEMIFSTFAPDHPEVDREDCVITYVNAGESDSYNWQSEPCDEEHYFICEIDPPTTTTITTTTITSTTSTPLSLRTTTTPTTTTTTPPATTTTVTTPTTTTTTAPPTTTTAPPTTTLTNTPPADPPTTTTTVKTSTTTTTTTTPAPTTTTVTGGSTKETTTKEGQSGQSSTPTGTPGTPGTGPAGSSTASSGSREPQTGDGDDDDLPTGVIIAIVVAAVAVFAGTIRLIVYCCQRRSGDKGDTFTNESGSSDRNSNKRKSNNEIENAAYTEPEPEDASQSQVNMTYAY